MYTANEKPDAGCGRGRLQKWKTGGRGCASRRNRRDFTAQLYVARAGCHIFMEKNARRATNFLRNEFSRLGVAFSLVDCRRFRRIEARAGEHARLSGKPTSWQFDLLDSGNRGFREGARSGHIIDNTWLRRCFRSARLRDRHSLLRDEIPTATAI